MEEQKQEEKNKKIDIRHNLELYYKIAKPYTGYFVAIVLVVLVLTAARIVDKFLLRSLIDRGTDFTLGIINLSQFMQVISTIVLVFALMIIARTVGQWIQLHLINRLDAGIILDMKRKFFNHLVGLAHRFHTTHKTGSMISRLSRGARAVEGITDFFIFNGAPLVLQLIVVGGSIYYFDRISSIIVAATAAVFISYSWLIIGKVQKARVEANNAEDREKANIGDVFTNIDSVKYFGKENMIKSIFAKLSGNTRKALLKSWDYYRWLESGQTAILWIGVFFMMYFPLTKFINGDITIGTVAFIYSAYFGLAEPLFGFMWGIRHFYESMADFQALFEYDKIKNEIEDKKNAKTMKIMRGKIEFKDISFSYHNKKIIDNLNLVVNPNEKVALVGHSGSGKTTIVKLLYRFYDVNEGNILIDSKNIKNFKQESLRGELSIVPQECVLFDDTIYNNISFSRPNAKKEEVMQAIKFAQLDKFVKELPQKENTIVGERGVKLSGGEKQRVSIARAILANKKILVLDEATSSLDSKTEFEIQNALQRLMKGRTAVIIAHRLSTIMRADKIVVIDKGKIAQIGRHEDLIEQKGIYKQLWNLQKGGYLKE